MWGITKDLKLVHFFAKNEKGHLRTVCEGRHHHQGIMLMAVKDWNMDLERTCPVCYVWLELEKIKEQRKTKEPVKAEA